MAEYLALDNDSENVSESGQKCNRKSRIMFAFWICFSLIIVTAIGALAAWSSLPFDSRKPLHIVFILVDDLGYGDVGWLNKDSLMYTPALDSLARDGVILKASYATPTCTPSRAAILTGVYPFKYGLQHDVIKATDKSFLPTRYTLLPGYLKDLGYSTHMIGKWHLGFCNLNYTPTFRGFDTFYGSYGGGQDFFTHNGNNDLYDFQDGTEADFSAKGHYSTDLFTQRALRLIDDHSVNKPFFLYLAFQAMHGYNSVQAPEEYIQEPHCSNISDARRRTYCGALMALDKSVAALLGELEEKHMLDNTLVVFTADNTASMGQGGSNWPFRGAKGELWEGGTRVPTFVYSKTLRNSPGSTYNGLFHQIDWLPTLIEAARGNNLKFANATLETELSSIDGVSQWVALASGGDANASPRKQFVYSIDDVDQNAAIRVGRFKLVEGSPGDRNAWYTVDPVMADVNQTTPLVDHPDVLDTYQIFDLEEDPMEITNLRKLNRTLFEELKQVLDSWKLEMEPSLKNVNSEREAIAAASEGAWKPGWC